MSGRPEESELIVSTVSAGDDLSKPALTTGSVVIPVIQEHAEVRKELRATNIVRVRKVVHQDQATIDTSIGLDTVQIERVPKDALLDSEPSIRMEGEVMIIPVVEEVLVTTKRLRLVEEVRVTKLRSNTVQQQNVTLRSEEIIIERGPASDPKTSNLS